MLHIDGSHGEGGGQILRTSLALSLLTREAFRLENVRARRDKPGLRRQHLTAVRAAAAVGHAEVTGAEVGSRDVTFRPTGLFPGDYRFDIGTAGSTTLVLQTILPALAVAGGPSRIALQGGTHNKHAPPYDFLERVYAPLVRRMGPRLELHFERPGFYPAGGGRFVAEIFPHARAYFSPIEVLERGPERARRAEAIVSRLPETIAEREIFILREHLGREKLGARVRTVDALGPGNAVLVDIESEHVTEVFSAIGERGLPAETVATAAALEARAYLDAGAPIGPHLADQLLLLLAIAGGGRFRTTEPTGHTRTQIEVIPRFLPVEIGVEPSGERTFDVHVRRKREDPYHRGVRRAITP